VTQGLKPDLLGADLGAHHDRAAKAQAVAFADQVGSLRQHHAAHAM
jgi:hypothetical protein